MSPDLLLDSGRFWSKVKGGPVEECWVWMAARNPQGYGNTTYRIDGKVKPQSAHRVAYRLLRGDPTPGLTLDHLCENPPCVNPWHLEEVPLALNIWRSRLRRRRGGTCDPQAPQNYSGRCRFAGDPGIYIALPNNDLLWATTAEYRTLTVDEMWNELLRHVPGEVFVEDLPDQGIGTT